MKVSKLRSVRFALLGVLCLGLTSAMATGCVIEDDDDCFSYEFDCGNGFCVDEAYVCDGVDDCGNGADEIGCGCYTDEYECDDGSCVPIEAECDMVYNDCGDWSDEYACDGCLADEIACDVDGNLTIDCVHDSLFCDGVADCWDGLDEDC
jgi:hypothetical protein